MRCRFKGRSSGTTCASSKTAGRFRQTNGRSRRLCAAPRIGPTRWSEVGTADDNHVKRRYALLGQTLDVQRVWDVRRGLGGVADRGRFEGSAALAPGQRADMAGIVLYGAGSLNRTWRGSTCGTRLRRTARGQPS